MQEPNQWPACPHVEEPAIDMCDACEIELAELYDVDQKSLREAAEIVELLSSVQRDGFMVMNVEHLIEKSRAWVERKRGEAKR